jgi:hypothetical protein
MPLGHRALADGRAEEGHGRRIELLRRIGLVVLELRSELVSVGKDFVY